MRLVSASWIARDKNRRASHAGFEKVSVLLDSKVVSGFVRLRVQELTK
jgi:hypothetical protein